MDLEIQSILDLGVKILYNTRIGEDITLADLRLENQAVFLGIGLMKGRMLNIEGSDLDGVITAVDLLLNFNMGYKVSLGKKVLVVGGGDVAMDAARTALRVGQRFVFSVVMFGLSLPEPKVLFIAVSPRASFMMPCCTVSSSVLYFQ